MIIIEGTALRPKPGLGALFLDRDGVINIDHGWVHKIEDFEWVPSIFETARAAASVQMPIIVVTNQGGIAKGLYDEAAFRKLTAWMMDAFAAEGAPLTRVVGCPHHPNGAVKDLSIKCPCRKPEPGMLLRCISDFDLDPARSVMIGDNETDMQAAIKSELKSCLLFQKHSTS